MKSISIAAILIIFVMMLCASTNAFDGNRKGFSAGIGMGICPYTYSSNNTLNIDNSSGGLGFNMFLGWGFDNKNIIAAEMNIVSAMDYDFELDFLGNPENSPRGGMTGVNWYHYYSNEHPTWFTVLGAGAYINTYDYTTTGIGFAVGGGYQFFSKFQIGTYFFQGYSDRSQGDYDYTNRMINVIATFIVY